MKEIFHTYLKKSETFVGGTLTGFFGMLTLFIFPVFVKNFNLMVLDVMMPGQSGYELTKEIKQSRNIPIILLTAKGEVENRIHGLELGADDYLGKPFEPQELLLRIKNIINTIKLMPRFTL